jgi:Carboxypeptidase regulatory-like domain
VSTGDMIRQRSPARYEVPCRTPSASARCTRLSRPSTEPGPTGTTRLEPKVMQLLVCLAEHAGAVVSRERLPDVSAPLRRASRTGGVTATLRGAVEDASEAVIPAAAVTLTNLATKDMRAAVTDDRGAFAFSGLFPLLTSSPSSCPDSSRRTWP